MLNMKEYTKHNMCSDCEEPKIPDTMLNGIEQSRNVFMSCLHEDGNRTHFLNVVVLVLKNNNTN
jgi:hypothetical protein